MTMTHPNQLHLSDLTIKGFRGIDELSIPRLGRVTLLAGKNSVGKTTVLDAVEVYAARGVHTTRGRYPALYSLLQDRDEMITTIDEDGDHIPVPDWEALFYGRDISQNSRISIGPSDVARQLTISTTTLSGAQASLFDASSDFVPTQVLKVVYGSNEQILPWTISFDESVAYVGHRTATARRKLRQINEADPPLAIRCESLGPGLLGNVDVARYWDNVALTNDKNAALEALRLAFDRAIDDVAVIGEQHFVGRGVGRRPMVRLLGDFGPVPLKSLGDGALRLFGVVLALANSRNGFLLIDEAENGVHHSVQHNYWRIVLQTAHENNVQVLATTHSWDCVTGFAQAATELEDVDGVLVRLSRSGGYLHAVDYPENELAIAAEQGIEVR